MRTTKFSSIAIAMLLTSLCLFLNINSTLYATTNPSNNIFKTGNRPIDLIQFMSSFHIVQEYELELLQITVLRKSDETIVHQVNSSSAETNISTEGWESDSYLVKVNAEQSGYCEFPLDL